MTTETDPRPPISPNAQGGRIVTGSLAGVAAAGAAHGTGITEAIVSILLYYIPEPEQLQEPAALLLSALVGFGVAFLAGRFGSVSRDVQAAPGPTPLAREIGAEVF